MMPRCSLFLCSICCVLQFFAATTRVEAEPISVGAVENVQIFPGALSLRAKLDTGADSTSLGADNLQYLQKGRELWVRFTLRTRDGEQQTLEFKTLRTTMIKQEGGRIEKRPVIRLGVCMGDLFMFVNANLTDRSNFAYPMLIGRDFIVGNLSIDPRYSYTTTPKCAIIEKNKATTKKKREKKY